MGAVPLRGFSSVRGHPHPLGLLKRAIASGRVASAYLFVGPDGVGKDRSALALAQTLNCRAPREGPDACGECFPCRRIAEGLHPDVIAIQRELKEPPKDPNDAKTRALLARRLEEIPEGDLSEVITVEQVTAMQARMPFRPHEGGRRVVIIREPERLYGTQGKAANRVLKTLEEPPADTHFVLLSARPSQVLTTIRSRCQVVRFGLLDDGDVVAALEGLGVDSAAARDAVALADGSIGKALIMLDPEAMEHRRGLMTAILTALKQGGRDAGHVGDFVDLAETAKGFEKRDLAVTLGLLHRYFRDEAVKSAGHNPRAATVHAARADVVRDARETLGGAVASNVSLVVQAMLVRLFEVRA